MEPSLPSSQNPTTSNADEEKINTSKCKDIISTFPRNYCLSKSHYDRLYQGFWYAEDKLPRLIWFQQHFQPKSTDIILATPHKSGTTWLKSLTFAIVTRHRFDDSTNPLLGMISHDLLPHLETDLVGDVKFIRDPEIPLVSTHLPYTLLPKSVAQKECKIIYLWRDAKDIIVSLWHFIREISKPLNFEATELFSLEEAFELYCQGVSLVGPYWDHVLSYWKVKSENPDKILFLKYEEMMKDTAFYVKKLAEFMGYPFTIEEEEQGELQKIVDMCSFERMSSLEVNKSGVHYKSSFKLENKAFFRTGKVGDWCNYLTAEMGARLDLIMEDKLKDSGLKI